MFCFYIKLLNPFVTPPPQWQLRETFGAVLAGMIGELLVVRRLEGAVAHVVPHEGDHVQVLVQPHVDVQAVPIHTGSHHRTEAGHCNILVCLFTAAVRRLLPAHELARRCKRVVRLRLPRGLEFGYLFGCSGPLLSCSGAALAHANRDTRAFGEFEPRAGHTRIANRDL